MLNEFSGGDVDVAQLRSEALPRTELPSPTRSAAGRVLSISHLSKTYPGTSVSALDDITFDVYEGELVSLVGPSGCGKTTTLKIISGLEHPTAGAIWLGDWALSTEKTWTPVHRRPFGMVFQSYALWPHMTVAQNVGYPLKARRVPRKEIRERVTRTLARVEMESFANRSPNRLSGGQQQRVAIARAIVHEPRVLLLDEPLSNLDAALRRQMRLDLRQLQQQLGITAIYVTHDQAEACALSDRVVVMNAGRIVGSGPPQEVYERPRSKFVAQFMGAANLLGGRLCRVTDSGIGEVEIYGRRGAVGRLRSAEIGEDALGSGDSMVRVLVRPEHIKLRVVQDRDAVPISSTDALNGLVESVTFLGGYWEVAIDLAGEKLLVHVQELGQLDVGSAVRATVEPKFVQLLSAHDE